MTDYKYERLENINDIRILTILPRHKDTIECTIQHASYSSTKYQALSYCWGEHTTTTYPITINGHICHVRYNLWRFLDNASRRWTGSGDSDDTDIDTDTVLNIWIDALCINQADDDEKMIQIGLMGKIYESSSSVLIWLGEDQVTYDLFSDLQSQAWDVVEDPAAWPPGIELSSNHADRRLAELADHKYWYRLWIIQEVALSRNPPRLLCRDLMIPWDQLFAKVYTSRWLHIEHSTGFMSNKLWSLMLVRREFQTLDPEPDQSGLHNGYRVTAIAETSECSNLKDRIFGILGLIQPYAGRTTVPGTYADNIALLACKSLVYYPHYFELDRLMESLGVDAAEMLAYLRSVRREGPTTATVMELISVEIRERDRATHDPFQPDRGRSIRGETGFPSRPRWAVRLTEYVRIFVDFQRSQDHDQDRNHLRHGDEHGNETLVYHGHTLTLTIRQDASTQTWQPNQTHLPNIQLIAMTPEPERHGGEAAATLAIPLSVFAWIFEVGVEAYLVQQSILRVDRVVQAGDGGECAGVVDVEIETLEVVESVCRFEY